MPSHTSESPAKKQSKWSPEEDALIIELRGSGMKWDDISKRLPGRSSISCRLHYQNYLERRSEWDEERKNKLARLYERFKPEMWAKVAEELQVPWRAAEAMHWQLGESDMARRAGVVPFSLNMTSNEPQGPQRISPTRGHAHSQSHGSLPRDFTGGLPSPRYTRGPHPQIPPLIPPPTPRSSFSARRDSLPPRHSFGPPLSELSQQPQQPAEYGYGLAPIQTTPLGPRAGSTSGLLPSVAELTTGVSPYSTPAYTLGGPPPPPPLPQQQPSGPPPSGTSPVHSSATGSPAPGSAGSLLPALSPYPHHEPAGMVGMGKRRASPPDGAGGRETSRRRHVYPPPPPPPGLSYSHAHSQPRGVEEGGGVAGGYGPPPQGGISSSPFGPAATMGTGPAVVPTTSAPGGRRGGRQ